MPVRPLSEQNAIILRENRPSEAVRALLERMYLTLAEAVQYMEAHNYGYAREKIEDVMGVLPDPTLDVPELWPTKDVFFAMEDFIDIRYKSIARAEDPSAYPGIP